jgi:hypothetical protein
LLKAFEKLDVPQLNAIALQSPQLLLKLNQEELSKAGQVRLKSVQWQRTAISGKASIKKFESEGSRFDAVLDLRGKSWGAI